LKALIYWHDFFLPYSEYLIEAFDKDPRFKKIIISGPKDTKVDSIFSVPTQNKSSYNKTIFLKLETYKFRPRFATIKSFYKAIKENNPDIIIVLDEAMSVNVFNAGLANYILGSYAKVFFYGFDNIPHKLPLKYLSGNIEIKSLLIFLKRTIRLYCFNYGLHFIRKKIVHGGLTCYSECTQIIREFGWDTPIIEQWWGLPLKKYFYGFNEADNIHIKKILGVSNKEKIIGYVGRFVKEKGILDLLEAFSGLNSSHILLMIGNGPLSNYIKKYAKARRISNRVKIISPKSQKELSSYYRVMNVLVLPSRTTYFWKEQFGRVLVEACSCGTSIVGSSSGAIPYVIRETKGIYFEEGNINQMKKAILSSTRVKKISDNFIPKILEKADVDNFINSFIKLYKKVKKNN
jgi:glycosyltransferase involved in cell wall biosynthesis